MFHRVENAPLQRAGTDKMPHNIFRNIVEWHARKRELTLYFNCEEGKVLKNPTHDFNANQIVILKTLIYISKIR